MTDMSLREREKVIRERISNVFQNEFEMPRETADGIGFHMTDWLGDVEELLNIYSHINETSDEDISAFVLRFLAHVPNHLNAAMKLAGLGPVTDVFEVGIFKEDE